MVGNEPLRQRSVRGLALGVLVAGLSLLTLVEPAHAIPSFARKYQTSCITCHTIYPKLNDVGEAFRRNGYQFPSDDDILVKEDPVKLGNDAYKDMFPNSIWPSTLPSIPPVSIFAWSSNVVNVQPHGQLKNWDLAFPTDVELIGAGTFGKDISGLYNLGFTPQDGASVGRVFVQFSNLLSWDTEENEDGTHRGCRLGVLPPHALNLRVGKIDPGIVPHVMSEESLYQFAPIPTNTFTLGQTGFILFSEQPAIELSGVIKQYWSYTLGIANGGSAATLPVDDNTFKDVYFNVSHKWFGFPYDGVLGQAGPACKNNVAPNGNEDPSEYAPTGLDFWRALSFETGVFGWYGKSNVPLTPSTGVPYDPNVSSTFAKDFFERIGLDARLKYFDLDLYGAVFWGHDPFPGFDQNNIAAGVTDHLGFFIEADYFIKPWICAMLRYEQVKIFNGALADEEQTRLVPGVVFAVRQNLRVSSEVYIDLRGVDIPNPDIPESTCQWVTTVGFAY